MSIKKRLSILALLSLLCVFGLYGCGDKQSNDENTTVSTETIQAGSVHSSSETSVDTEYTDEITSEYASSDVTVTHFTNAYGTATTKCAHSGCNNYIASSGDTNCCAKHSKRCLECNKYIDEDALYCVSCIAKAANEVKSQKHNCEECGKEGIYSFTGFSGEIEYYCSTHYRELLDMMQKILGGE